MKKPTSWTDRLEIEDETLYRILRAELNSKKCYYEIDVYKENDLGETFCQNLYSSSWGGYVVAFPGLPMNPNKNSWYYNNNIAEEDGFAECKKCNVGTSRSVTESDLELVYQLYPDFRYVAKKYKILCLEQLMKILVMWKKHPELEMILACGYFNVGMNNSFWRLSEKKQKEICLFMRKSPQFCDVKLNHLLSALRTQNPKLYLKYLDNVPSYRRGKKLTDISFLDYQYLLKNAMNEIDIPYYQDYLIMAEPLHDITQEYWRHPKNLLKAHDKVLLEKVNLKKAEEERLEKERIKVIKKIEKKYGFKDTEIDGYHIFVSASLDVWEQQADCLHQCILKAGYRDKMFNQKSVIVFIQKNGTPQATAEISNDGKRIVQFYADEFDRNNCLPSEEIKAAFQKWLNLKKPRNQSKKQKEVA